MTDENACSLPADSDYVRNEIHDMASQLEHERRLTGDATAKTLFKEMVTIPGNRKRAIISVVLMICQQMTGVNAIVRTCPDTRGNQSEREGAREGVDERLTVTTFHRTTMRPRFSRTSA